MANTFLFNSVNLNKQLKKQPLLLLSIYKMCSAEKISQLREHHKHLLITGSQISGAACFFHFANLKDALHDILR